MDIEFDGEKDRANREKHGISLAAAMGMDMEAALIAPDLRRDHGEARFRAIGPIAGHLHSLAFTMRGETLRAISLRKASIRERRLYERS